MIALRKSADRGHVQLDWLSSYHSFSFDTYYNPDYMGFRSLRVINQDRVAPGKGFPLHPHSDMEILSLVLEGALKHRDNLGSEEIIRAGELQRISAGTGVMHSEYNPSEGEDVHFLQIWILPECQGLKPGYEKKRFATKTINALQLFASRQGREDSAIVHQDTDLYIARFEAGHSLNHPMASGRHAWLQLISGRLELNGNRLQPGDGAAVSEETELQLRAEEDAEFLLFDLN